MSGQCGLDLTGGIYLLTDDVTVTCVPGELLNHDQQCPSHADGSFDGQIDGVVEIEPGGDGARSCAGALELINDVGQGLVIVDSKGFLHRVVRSRRNRIRRSRPNAFGTKCVLPQQRA